MKKIIILLAFTFSLLNVATLSAGLIDSSWPCKGHDTRRTGQSPYIGSQHGIVKWSFQTGDDVQSSAAIAPDGTIYVGSRDNKIYALNHDGTLKWSIQTGGDVESSPAIAADGTIYFGSRDKMLYAVNPDGTLKWTYLTEFYVTSSPIISADGTIYFGAGDGDNRIYALNPDGTLKWAHRTGGWIISSPAIGEDGTIYCGSTDGRLYALNPVDGSLKWKYKVGFKVWSTPAIGDDGTIYVGSGDMNLYALNPDGSVKWKFYTGEWVRSSPSVGNDGTIYCNSSVYLYAVNPDGSLKWKYNTGFFPYYSSPVIGADRIVYFGSGDNVYALSPDGSLKWKYCTQGGVWSSPAINSDGTVYIGSNDGKLYAFGPVEDNDPPEIVCNDVIVSVAGNNTKVNYLTKVTDNIDPDPEVVFEPGPDSLFPIGTTEVTVTAVDFAGNLSTCIFTVTVKTEPLGPSPWPCEGYNAKHTCQSPYIGSETNSVKWMVQFDDMITSPVIGIDGTIYFGCSDQNIYALNPDKSIKWTFPINAGIPTTPAIGNDGTIYFGCDCERDSNNHAPLYALNQDGVLKWLFDTGNCIVTQPVIGSDGTIYIGSWDEGENTIGKNGLFVGNTQGRLTSINPDGTIKWSCSLESPMNSFPAIGDEGTIYFVCADGRIRALDQNGTLKWKSSTSYTSGHSLAVGADNTIYLGCSNGFLYATTPDGNLKWSINKSVALIGPIVPAISSDGTIYFKITERGGSSGIYFTTYTKYYRKIYALNADGKEKWSYTLSEFTRSYDSSKPIWPSLTIIDFPFQLNYYSCLKYYSYSYPAIGADGTVYVGSDDGRIYALNPDGSLKWSYQGEDISFLSPAIGADGSIYVGSDDGKLYAFGPADTDTDTDSDNQCGLHDLIGAYPFLPWGINWSWCNNIFRDNQGFTPYWGTDWWPNPTTNWWLNDNWWNYDYLISPWTIQEPDYSNYPLLWPWSVPLYW